MIINADSLLPHLLKKVRPMHSDLARHLLCPDCKKRTKLNTLGDGRRKCTVCGKKFRIHKVTESNKLQQCAEILLCFCLDFSAHRAAQITGHRDRLVTAYFDHFRLLIAEKSLPPDKVPLLTSYAEDIRFVPQDKGWCRWCREPIRSLDAGGKTPVFGVRCTSKSTVYLDPLEDEHAVEYFHELSRRDDTLGSREGYAGFICCGKFHHFTDDVKVRAHTEQLWIWVKERIRTHHRTWRQKRGLYLKELEWKYNNRSLGMDQQAKKFIEMMPSDFLTLWS